MAENSSIEWTTHTFNPWWGCVKVSPACKYCYAELAAKRYGHQVWGINADRRTLSDKAWALPKKWNAAAAAAGERARVFCASMADVYEDRRDLDLHRQRLWKLIEATPHLDWLLLTKRPEHIASLTPWGAEWPGNVWIGTTVENQKIAEERLPYLAALPAAVRFISAEPLLGPLDVTPWADHLDWVITGGESGGKSRPSSPSWFVDLKDQCASAGVAFHFKQWGNWVPQEQTTVTGRRSKVTAADGTTMLRMSKKLAGRELDGATWDGLPVPRTMRRRPRRLASPS
jgi:protein gp37